MTISSVDREKAGDALETSALLPGREPSSPAVEGFAAALVASGWLIASGRSGGNGFVWPSFVLCPVLLLLAMPFSGRGLMGRIRLSAAHLAVVALLVFTAQRGLARWEEDGPRLTAFAYVSSAVLNALGYRSAAERGLLLINHPDGLVTLSPSPEKLAAGAFVVFWVAWVALLTLRRGLPNIGRWCTGLVITLLVALSRFLIGLMIYIEHDQILGENGGQATLDLFGSPWVTIPSLFIAGLVLDRAMRATHAIRVLAPTSRRPREFLAAGASMLGACGLAGFALAFVPLGVEKPGRILIDDRFCGIWEPTARLLDTEWYGDFPTYSFTSLAEWLGKWFSVDVNIDQAYDDKLLSKYDVLIIKTPETSIPDRESEAIDRFVRRGGGLLLVGDHTNLLGMSTHLNALSAKYGIRFRYDSVSDAATGGFVNYYGPAIGRHVGALHVDRLEFMTSCSLQLSGSAEAVLAADNCRREPHDYAASSFFGRRGPHPELEHGRTVLAAAVQVGHGRVAAFTDSTVWSSFAVFEKGREKLAMDLIRLLNRGPSPYELPIRIVAMLALVSSAVLLSAFVRSSLTSTALFFGLLGGWSGVAVSDGLHYLIYAQPPPNSPVDEVTFLWQGGACASRPSSAILARSRQIDASTRCSSRFRGWA